MSERHLNTDPILGVYNPLAINKELLGGNVYGAALSRREFIKLAGTLGASAALAACSPNLVYPDKTARPENNGDMKEFSEFTEIAVEMTNLFGIQFLHDAPPIIRDVYIESLNARKGQLSERFAASRWGNHVGELDMVVENHARNLKEGIEVITPDLKVYPRYSPPDKAALQFVEDQIDRLGQTFPVLSLAAGKYKLRWHEEMADIEKTYACLKIDDNSLHFTVPYPSGVESFVVAQIHETGHANEYYYLNTSPYISLSQFAKVPTSRLREAYNIAKDWFKLQSDGNAWNDYGFSVNRDFDDLDNIIFLQKLQSTFPDIAIPQHMQLDWSGDNDETANRKRNLQFNFIMQKIGRSRLDEDGKYTDTPDRIQTGDEALSAFFNEVFHYLVGPHQGLKGNLPTEHLPNEQGIRKWNLVHHKVLLEVYAGPGSANDPAAIRTGLGLEANPTLPPEIVQGINIPKITDFQVSQICDSTVSFSLNTIVQKSSTRITPLSTSPLSDEYKALVETNGTIPVYLTVTSTGTYFGIEIKDSQNNTIGAREIYSDDLPGKTIALGLDDSEELLAFALPHIKPASLAYTIVDRKDVIQEAETCP